MVKLAITRSSSDSVKASIQPAAIDGSIRGSVTAIKACTGEQPRSIAASSSERSSSDRREEITTVTKATQKVTCAIQIVISVSVNAMIAVAITYVPHYARLTRAAVITELSKEYVTASRVAGASTPRLMLDTVLPNCMAPLIIQATLSFSTAILDAAALGFLGLGAQAPTPEWGTMLADSLKFLQRAPWVVTFPGLAILITVLAINVLGDGLRDALDPKLKRS